MNSDSELILELWYLMKDLVSTSEKSDYATKLLTIFEDYGFDPSELKDLEGEDKDIDEALRSLYGEYESEEEEWED